MLKSECERVKWAQDKVDWARTLHTIAARSHGEGGRQTRTSWGMAPRIAKLPANFGFGICLREVKCKYCAKWISIEVNKVLNWIAMKLSYKVAISNILALCQTASITYREITLNCFVILGWIFDLKNSIKHAMFVYKHNTSPKWCGCLFHKLNI